MIPVRTFSGKKVAVFGLARSGLAATEALLAGGAEVLAWDDNESQRQNAEKIGARTKDLYEADWSVIDACILSPGVPLTHPAPHAIVLKAYENDVEIIGDVELFAREQIGFAKKRPLICITGTNGKSTTTSLVGHVLKEGRVACEVGGNIGQPALALTDFAGEKNSYVLEVSSYQLDLAPSLRPQIAVLLNITPDHLDRHGGMKGYVSSKKKIFSNQERGDTAIVSVDDPYTAEICSELSQHDVASVIPISVGKALSRGVYVIDGILFDGLSTPAEEVVDLHECDSLPGRHNWQNAAAAYAVGRALKIPRETIVQALISFKGLVHRLETVGEINGIRFVNDSKATNIEAASHALASFEDIYWIAGGRRKTNSLDRLKKYVPYIRRVYLIGEAADEFSRSLGSDVDWVVSETLGDAVGAAYRDAKSDKLVKSVVLLSPACASFDQFVDFEERGDRFRSAVEELIEREMQGGAAA